MKTMNFHIRGTNVSLKQEDSVINYKYEVLDPEGFRATNFVFDPEFGIKEVDGLFQTKEEAEEFIKTLEEAYE